MPPAGETRELLKEEEGKGASTDGGCLAAGFNPEKLKVREYWEWNVWPDLLRARVRKNPTSQSPHSSVVDLTCLHNDAHTNAVRHLREAGGRGASGQRGQEGGYVLVLSGV